MEDKNCQQLVCSKTIKTLFTVLFLQSIKGGKKKTKPETTNSLFKVCFQIICLSSCKFQYFKF